MRKNQQNQEKFYVSKKVHRKFYDYENVTYIILIEKENRTSTAKTKAVK